MQTKLKVGDKVYEWRTERGKNGRIVEHTIHSIGNKYFYLCGYHGEKDARTPITKSDLRHHSDRGSGGIQLYLTEHDFDWDKYPVQFSQYDKLIDAGNDILYS